MTDARGLDSASEARLHALYDRALDDKHILAAVSHEDPEAALDPGFVQKVLGNAARARALLWPHVRDAVDAALGGGDFAGKGVQTLATVAGPILEKAYLVLVKVLLWELRVVGKVAPELIVKVIKLAVGAICDKNYKRDIRPLPRARARRRARHARRAGLPLALRPDGRRRRLPVAHRPDGAAYAPVRHRRRPRGAARRLADTARSPTTTMWSRCRPRTTRCDPPRTPAAIRRAPSF